MSWIIGVVLLIMLLPLLRMLGAILIFGIVVIILASSNTASVSVSEPAMPVRQLTYQELRDYPLDCAQADSQLAELRAVQSQYNFDSDVDQLTPDQKAWNGIIKSNIWWFAYRCNKS
jgi:hypothetical protein